MKNTMYSMIDLKYDVNRGANPFKVREANYSAINQLVCLGNMNIPGYIYEAKRML